MPVGVKQSRDHVMDPGVFKACTCFSTCKTIKPNEHLMAKKRARGSASAKKQQRGGMTKRPRKGYSSVARTRGAQVTGEMKYFDTERTSVAIAASVDWTGTEYDPATFNTLFAPTVGAGVNQRIGKSVKVHKIKIHGLLNVPAQANQAAADVADVVRLAVVQDCQTNAAQAQGEQVFTSPTSATAYQAVCSFQNIDNFGRFKVLKDKTIKFPQPILAYDGTNIEQGGFEIPFKFSLNFKTPVVVRFNATNGGTIADIVDNSWHVMANATGVTTAQTIIYNSRVCYKE